MNNVSIDEVLTSSGIEYRITRGDGIILATTCIKHYAKIILKAIENDIQVEDKYNT